MSDLEDNNSHSDSVPTLNQAPRISILLSRKISDGEYGSTGVDVGISIDVPEDVSIGDFVDEVYGQMREKLFEKLRAENLID